MIKNNLLICNIFFIKINYNNLTNIIFDLSNNKFIKQIIKNNIINNIKIQYNENKKKKIIDNLNNLYKFFIVKNNLILINNFDNFKNELDNILKINLIKDRKNIELHIEFNVETTDIVKNMRNNINNKLIHMKKSREKVHDKFQIILGFLLIIIHLILANILLTFEQKYINLPNSNSIFGIYLLNHLLLYYIFSNSINYLLIFNKLSNTYTYLSLILLTFELSKYGLSKIFNYNMQINNKKITNIAEDLIIPGVEKNNINTLQGGSAIEWNPNMANYGAIKGSILTSVIMIIVRSIVLSVNKNIPVFDVMFWIMMIFANVLGFTFDQIYAKEEGFYITNPSLLNGKNLYVNQNHSGLNIINQNDPNLAKLIGVNSADDAIPFINFNESKSIILNLSKYIGYNLLSVEFFKFIIIVCVDIAFASFLYNVLKDWMKESGLFPECYTTNICCKLDNNDNIIKSSCCNNNEDDEECKKNKYDTNGKSFDTMIDTVLQLTLSLITFYLFVNNFRIQWAYNTNIFEASYSATQLSIITFGLLTTIVYKLQKNVLNPSFAQTSSFKSMLFCIIILLVIILEPFIELNKMYSNNPIFNNSKAMLGIAFWCIICIGIPVWKLIPTAKKNNEEKEKKCHTNLLEQILQQTPLNQFEHIHSA